MSGLVELIKLPLYRIFMPVAVGVVFVFLVAIGKISIFSINGISFKIFLECFDQVNVPLIQIGNVKIFLPNFVTIIAFLTITFVIGEVFSMIGELIVNLFFGYWPVRPLKEENKDSKTLEKDYLMEKIFPCSDNWFSYWEFVIAIGGSKVAAEISEVHFVMSRFFAGLMAVSLATINILLPCVIAIVASLTFLIFRFQKFQKFNCIFLFIFVGGLIMMGIILFSMLIYIKIKKIILVVLLFVIFFFLTSVYYRAHANLLNITIIKEKYISDKGFSNESKK